MNPENYINVRLDDQIRWYDSKSRSNKKKYYITNTLCIFLSALIPTLVFLRYNVGANLQMEFDMFIGFTGILLMVLFSLSLLYNYQDKWNHYRGVAEKLKAERNLYKNASGIYQDDHQPDKLLVERVESLISPRHS